jgi:hypothetical protein
MGKRKETVHDKVEKQAEDLEVRTIHQSEKGWGWGEECFNIVTVEVRFATVCNRNNRTCIV